jgi:predicted amidophosphoribosyltransferase
VDNPVFTAVPLYLGIMRLLPGDGGVLRPDACLGCARPAAWPCCAGCLPDLAGGPGPWALAADPALTVWALGDYGDGLRAAIVAGKLRGQGAALRALGRRLGSCLDAAGVGADLVTWVASRPARGTPRDHARLVAEGVADVLRLPAVALLRPAAGPDLGKARRGPLLAAARPPPAARRRLAGGRVLLVDDVATTGATLAGAASSLLTAGAAAVEAAALAIAGRAINPQNPPTGVASRDP